MFKGFYNLTSGMLTQGRHLDVISNNITNVATAGFKADRYTASTFQEVMWSLVGNKEKNYTELGMQSWITAPSQLYTDFSQASFDETNQPLDFAIEDQDLDNFDRNGGVGFFAIQTGDGRAYTRNGNFSLDDEGFLVLPGQGRVLDPSGAPIQLITDRIQTDDYGGLYTQDGTLLGRIGVFVFDDTEQLEKNAQGLFTANGQGTPTNVLVHHGMTERSNVDWVQALSEMIATQRAYQSAAEVIKIYDNVINRDTTEVGRLT